MKPLGTLVYHKDGVQSLAFTRRAPATPATIGDEATDSDSDDEMIEAEKAARARWLVSGGKDSRVAIWELMDFSKKA
ncbi:hypothetical protein EWM64_g383 [Hericium alpestre]|uniref:Uncharacterized protein n=1 Tax=Hericium alpestre TaxID=135208 RepID=A0A4Z0A975_9AGAM|nr:hypothetical protein EWM64_g383 [Hericium alpestre]